MTGDDAKSPLLGNLDAGQKRLIELLSAAFRTHGAWPPWQFVEQTMDNEGLDPLAVMAGLPTFGRSRGIDGLTYGLVWSRGDFGSLYQPSDPVGLTVAGWQQAGAEDIVSLFLGVLGLATRRAERPKFWPSQQIRPHLKSTSQQTAPS